MKSNVELLVQLYREIVGPEGSSDIPEEIPAQGYCFAPMPTVNKLWTDIRFGIHQPEGKFQQSAILKVYAPGAGPDGQDAVYLEVQAFDPVEIQTFDPSESPRKGHNIFLYDKVPGREIDKIKECEVILNLYYQICSRELKAVCA